MPQQKPAAVADDLAGFPDQPKPTGPGGEDLSAFPDQTTPKPHPATKPYTMTQTPQNYWDAPIPMTPGITPAHVADTVIGAGKGVLNTMYGLGKLVHDYTPIGRISDRIQPGAFEDHNKPEILTPHGTAEHIGYGGEQVAEFFVPSGAVAESVKGLDIAQKLIRRGVKPARAALAAATARGTAEAASTYVQSTAQGSEHPGTAALISGVAPVIGTGLVNQARTIRDKALIKIENYLKSTYPEGKITPRIERIAKNAAIDILDTHMPTSWKNWMQSTAGARNRAGLELAAEKAGAAGDVQVPLKPLIDDLDDLVASKTTALARARIPGTQTIVRRPMTYDPALSDAVDALKETLMVEVPTIVNGKRVMQKVMPNSIAARDLHDIKAVWQEAIYGRNDSTQPVASIYERLSTAAKKARQTGVGAISDVLQQRAPSIRALDEVVSRAIKLDQMVKRLATKAPVPRLVERAFMTSGALAGGKTAGAVAQATGMPTSGAYWVGGAVGAAAGRALAQALKSPMWVMLPPVVKNRLANAIYNGKGDQVLEILAPLMSGTVSVTTQK